MNKQLDRLYSQPSESLYDVCREIKTASIIYDYQGMKDVVDRMKEDIALVANAKLNLALKATHTRDLLSIYAEWGLGCDVASVGEYNYGQSTGFKEITTTNPAYSVKDMHFFHKEGLTIDVDSVSQLQVFGEQFPGADVGLRLRIPLPEGLNTGSSFGADSRFGIAQLDEHLSSVLERYQLNVTRLHVHTGQMNPESLLYKTDYLLTIAGYFPHVHTIDFGGGMFHLYVSREKAREAFKLMNKKMEQWKSMHDRDLQVRFEPGGALLAGCGYLVTSVMAVDYHTYWESKIVTVNASAWNLAPWHKPQIINLSKRNSAKKEKILLAGNTLYEGDYFGIDTNGQSMDFELPEDTKVGDTLLMTASGAYTMTNSRRFNRLPLPQEYLMKKDELYHINPDGRDYA